MEEDYETALSKYNVSSENSGNLRELGLKTLSALLENFADIEPSALVKPVETVSNIINSLPPNCLFTDWSPYHIPPGKEVYINPELCFSSDCSKKPRFALANEPDEWSSTKNNDNECSFWGVSFSKEIYISEIEISFTNNCSPDYIVIESEEDKKYKSVGFVKIDGLQCKHILIEPFLTNKVRLLLFGYQKSKCHSIDSIKFFTPESQTIYTDSFEVLKDLSNWLVKCTRTNNKEVSNEAIKTLYTLALRSGSLSIILSVMNVFLNNSNHNTLFDEDTAKYWQKELIEFSQTLLSLNNSSDSSNNEPRKTAVFKPELCSSGITIERRGRVARCSNENKHHALVDYPCDTGRHSWSFKIIEDKNGDEMSCFGAAITPVLNSEYSTSPQLWMWRAYNGQLYSKGSVLSDKAEKVHQGDVVRFELNCNLHELHLFLNDKEMNGYFEDVTGVIYPAVSYYGSGRAIELVNIETLDKESRNDDGSIAHRMNEMTGKVIKGTLLKSENTCFNGNSVQQYISLSMAGEKECSISYDIEKSTYYRLSLKLALNDDVGKNKNFDIKLKVYGNDDILLYTSPSIQETGVYHYCQVFLLPSIEKVRFEVVNSGSSTSNCDVLFIDPCLYEMKDKSILKIYAEYEQRAPKNYEELAQEICLLIEKLCVNEIKKMSSKYQIDGRNNDSCCLEESYSIECSSHTFYQLYELLNILISNNNNNNNRMIMGILEIINANIRRLVYSHTNLNEYIENDDISNKLLNLILKIEKDMKNKNEKEISNKCDEILINGCTLFYPRITDREKLLFDDLRDIVTVEFQFKFPIIKPNTSSSSSSSSSYQSYNNSSYNNNNSNREKSNENDRKFDTLLLLVQSYLSEREIKYEIKGEINEYIYLIMELKRDLCIDFFHNELSKIMMKIGLNSWNIMNGNGNEGIYVNNESSIDFNRLNRIRMEPGVLWITIYKVEEEENEYEKVVKTVEEFLKTLEEMDETEE